MPLRVCLEHMLAAVGCLLQVPPWPTPLFWTHLCRWSMAACPDRCA
jgi:hypothetical protein